MNYIKYTASGEIVGLLTCSESDLALNTLPGELIVEGVASFADYIVAGVVTPLPLKPSPFHTFNYTTKQWEDQRTLQQVKDQQWEIVKAKRFESEYAGFEWDGSRFDSDAVSQQRLSGAVQLAQMSPTFSIAWTLADDTIRTLNQADMIAVGVALGVHVQTNFSKGQQLRAQIDAATTKEDVESIVW